MNQTIGDRTTANRLFDFLDGNPYSGYKPKRAPKGFRRIGHGANRVAYRENATGIVYKVGDQFCNFNESLWAEKIRNLPKNNLDFQFNAPATTCYKTSYGCVNAQEFVKGRYTACDSIYNRPALGMEYDCTCSNNPCFGDALRKLADITGLFDLHDGNVLIENGIFWIIDMGERL